jgi:hypothetical protein
MNRFVNTSIALGISALSVTGAVLPAFAASHSHNDRFRGRDGNDITETIAAAAPATGSGSGGSWLASDATSIDKQIRRLPAGGFTVVGLNATEDNSAASDFRLRAGEPGYLANLHRAIESNRPLVARLEARNVEIRNVIGAEPAANGTMTFYVM